MKQRDAAVSARGDNVSGQVSRGGTAEAQKGGVDSSSAAALAKATAALQQQQQRAHGLEEKVADLEARLELALADKDRSVITEHKTNVNMRCISYTLEGASKTQLCAQRMRRRQLPMWSKWRQL